MMSRPSASLSVTIASDASRSISVDVSTSSPSSLPPSAAFASPAPTDAATSATVTGWSYCRDDPSGKRIETISFYKTPAADAQVHSTMPCKRHVERAKAKKNAAPHFEGPHSLSYNCKGESGPRLASLRSCFGQRSRCHLVHLPFAPRRLLQF